MFSIGAILTSARNNFDLLRLLAAIQVALLHSAEHLDIDLGDGVFSLVLELFPGVPLFFFISGYLISLSYERKPDLKVYTVNRLLRIYPALLLCIFVSILSVALFGYFQEANATLSGFLIWVFAQVTVGQFYNPEFMRGYGVGVLNGSLWTITVELQFYILVPLMYRYLPRDRKLFDAAVLLLALFFVVINGFFLRIPESFDENILLKLFKVSFIPWFYMFLVGVMFQRYHQKLYSLLAGKVIWILMFYLVVSLFLANRFGYGFGNSISPISYFLLAGLVFSAAHTLPTLSRRLLGGHDISYGVYIYHMPIVNALIYFGLQGELKHLALALFLSITFALLSWKLIEVPALRLKPHSLSPQE